MPDLTLPQFLLLALAIIGTATALALCIVATMFGADDPEDEIPEGPKVQRWPVDYSTEHL